MSLRRRLKVFQTGKKIIKSVEDAKNRQYVINKTLEYMRLGFSRQEAIEIMMGEDIIKEFDYLTQNGVDIKKTINDWIDHKAKLIEEDENMR